MSFDPAELLKGFDSNKLEALVETMYLAADADGEFSDEERDQLAESIQGLVAGSSHESSLAGDKLSGLLDRARSDLDKEGRDSRIAAVKKRLGEPSHRKGALGLAIVVTAADGVMRTSEREFLLDLATALDVDRDEAADMVRDITRGGY